MVKLEIGRNDAIEMATHMMCNWEELPVDTDGSIYLVSAEQYKFLEDVYACIKQGRISGEVLKGPGRTEEEKGSRIFSVSEVQD